MGYIANTDIEKRLGAATYVQLTDDDGNGVGDAAVVDEARLAAEGEVDSYLGRRYAVPISLVSFPELAGLLRSAALDLAELRLRSRRPPAPPEAIRRAAETVEWLRRIGSGELALPTAAEVPTTTARGPIAKAAGNPRVLTTQELESI